MCYYVHALVLCVCLCSACVLLPYVCIMLIYLCVPALVFIGICEHLYVHVHLPLSMYLLWHVTLCFWLPFSISLFHLFLVCLCFYLAIYICAYILVWMFVAVFLCILVCLAGPYSASGSSCVSISVLLAHSLSLSVSRSGCLCSACLSVSECHFS